MLRRRLLGVVSLLSLVLCGMTVVLWVRSHLIRDLLRWDSKCDQSGAITWQLCSDTGRLIVERLSYSGPPRRNQPPWWHGYEFAHGGLAVPWSGEPSYQTRLVDWYGERLGPYSTWTFRVIYWPLIPLTPILPALSMLRRTRRLRRLRAGLCPSCGYDLRATPGRCSECGWREGGGDAK
jgi:hypothetical protein